MLVFEPFAGQLRWWSQAAGGTLRADRAAVHEHLARQARSHPTLADYLIVLPSGGLSFPRPVEALAADAWQRLEHEAGRMPGNAAAQIAAAAAAQAWPRARGWLLSQTAWFASLPPAAAGYGLPPLTSEARRFGGHGLWHSWLAGRAQAAVPSARRWITVWLDDESSVCAVVEGHPVDTSQGFSPVEGLPGAHSSGTVDPGALLALAEMGIGWEALALGLAAHSGWSASLGQETTLVDLIGRQPEAVYQRLFYRLVEQAGAMAASMGGFDGVAYASPWFPRALPLARQITGWLSRSTGLLAGEQDGALAEGEMERLSQPGSPIPALAFFAPIWSISCKAVARFVTNKTHI